MQSTDAGYMCASVGRVKRAKGRAWDWPTPGPWDVRVASGWARCEWRGVLGRRWRGCRVSPQWCPYALCLKMPSGKSCLSSACSGAVSSLPAAGLQSPGLNGQACAGSCILQLQSRVCKTVRHHCMTSIKSFWRPCRA